MSLRSRLLLGMAVVALVLVAGAVAVARTTEVYMLSQVDEQLASVAGRVPGGPRASPRDDRLDIPPQDETITPPSEETRQFSPLYVGFLPAGGDLETIVAPDLLDDVAPEPTFDAEVLRDAAVDGGVAYITANAGDTRYRVRLTTDEVLGDIEVVALPLDDTDAAIARLIAVEAVATVAALGVLGIVAWWVIRLGVRPVKKMADAAAEIAEGRLSSRVPEGDPRTEAGELGHALNQMLGRIEDAFDERARTEQRLRRFVADASHELRTPIATILGYAELYQLGGLDGPGELDDAMRRTRDEGARMGGLVEDMLQLARLDQGRPLRADPVDLAVLARDTVADALATDPRRPVRAEANGSVVVAGDEDRLRQVLANLVANAMVHTPAGTAVSVRAHADHGEAVLEVSDDGPGMSPDTAAHAFERFYRGDPSRSRAAGGTGLGLAIVAGIVTAHRGQITLVSSPGEGTTVRISLPELRPWPSMPLHEGVGAAT